MNSIIEFYKILLYCFKTLWVTSKKYFIIRNTLNIISLAVPFIIILVTRSLMNLLVNYNTDVKVTDTIIQTFLILSLLLLSLNVLKKVVETVNEYYAGLYRETMNTTTKHLIMKKAAELDLSFFDSTEFYNEMCDANSNSYLITQSAFQALDIIQYIVQFIIAFGYLFQFDFILPIIFVISVIPCTIAELKQVEAVYGFQRHHLKEERKMQYAADVLLSREFAKDVRLYNIYSFISQKFLNTWKVLFSKKRKISLRYTKLLLALSTMPEIVAATFLVLLGLSVIQGIRTIGDYTFLQGIMTQILGSVYMLISSYSQLIDGKMRILNFMNFIELNNSMREEGSQSLNKTCFTIEFKNVSFRYDDELPWVLKNVSFSFYSQEKIALVGANGSGKTTIVKLLLRFYDPVEGQILMDGKDIREYTLQSIRSHFSTVFQDYCNYAFNIKESVTLSDISQADDDRRVIAALVQSGANSFTEQFPQGLNTYLTRRYDESGQELSVGQWQKIAIARGFFREADIYILDEPSASLDAQSEDEVFHMFETLYDGKGAVLISHRLSNIHMCDLIIVIKNGHLVEKGSHEELIKANGVYAYMYRLQADKYNCTW